MAKEPKNKKAGEEEETSKKKPAAKRVARVSSKHQAKKKKANKKKDTKAASKAAVKKNIRKKKAAAPKKVKKADRKAPAKKKAKTTTPKGNSRKKKRARQANKPSAGKKKRAVVKKKIAPKRKKAARVVTPQPRVPEAIPLGRDEVVAFVGDTDAAVVEALASEITNPDWQAVAHFDRTPGRPFTLYTCDMIVPQKPADHIGQTIIIFIGLQSFAESRIVQPILQWGRSQMDGGGRHWSVGSCLAKGQFVLEEKSDLFEVEPGTHLRAVIEGKSTGGNFRYSCFFEGMEHETRIETNRIPELENCCVTLEAARIESRENYPADPLIAISNIEIKSGSQVITPDWRIEGFSQHGEQATADQHQVELRF
jgi:hypothetical protein